MSVYGSDFILSLKPAKYSYIPEMEEKGIDTKATHFGVMAQDIKKYLESTSDEKFNIIQYDEKNNMMVNYYELIGPLIKTVQEQNERISELEKQIKENNE